MFAIASALLFCGAAVFALVVITEMVRGYRPMIEAALRGQPMPRTRATAYHQRTVMRQRRLDYAFMPQRLERAREAA